MIIRVEVDEPKRADREEIAQYVVDALTAYGGGLHPCDPMFHGFRHRIKRVTIGNNRYEVEEYNPGKQE